MASFCTALMWSTFENVDADRIWSVLFMLYPTVWKSVTPYASLIDWRRADKVMVLVECGILILLSSSLVFFRVVLLVDFKNWCCLAITCKVPGSELLSTAIGINLRKGQNGSRSAVIERYRQERATIAQATSSTLHLMKIASTEVEFMPLT